MNPNEIYQFLEEDFRIRNQRISKGVKMVTDILLQAPHFLSAHEIAKELNNKINHSTVYRILNKLQTSRVVHEFQGRWKICTDPENTEESHHFLICQECGKTDEIFLDYFDSIAQQLKQEKNFKLTQVHLGFLGICKNCQK